MRFGSFLALIQCVFLPAARSAPGQAPALPVTLISISSSEQKMDGWSSKGGIQWRLIWIVFKWKPGRRVRQVWWILTSHRTLLETVARNCHLEGSLCGTVQIIGEAQWITPIMTTSTICHTNVTPFWSNNYTAAILTLGLPEALTCVYRQIERHQAFI